MGKLIKCMHGFEYIAPMRENLEDEYSEKLKAILKPAEAVEGEKVEAIEGEKKEDGEKKEIEGEVKAEVQVIQEKQTVGEVTAEVTADGSSEVAVEANVVVSIDNAEALANAKDDQSKADVLKAWEARLL